MARLNQRGLSRRALMLLAGGAALAIGSFSRHAVADVTESWAFNGSGNWTTPADWSPGTNYPNNGTPAGTNYQAVVALPGSAAYTVTANTNLSVDSLSIGSSNATVNDISHTLTVGGLNISSGVFELAGGTLSGGATGATVTLGSPSEFDLVSGTLNSLTFAGSDLNFSPSGLVHITGGLNLSGHTLNLTPSYGVLLFDGPSQTIDDLTIASTSSSQCTLDVGSTSSFSPAPLTLGANTNVHGNVTFSQGVYISKALINNGTLNADTNSATLAVATGSFTNNAVAEASNGGTLLINAYTWTNAAGGTITANASTLTLGGTWTNSGTISAVNQSVVNLGGTFTPANMASISVSADSSINITGTLNNAGNTLTLSSSPPQVTLLGGTISGGNVAFGNNLNIVTGTLSGVTVPSGGTIQVTAGGTLNLAGSWTNQGSINVAAGAMLNLGGTIIPSAVGIINVDSSATINITGTVSNSSSTLTLGGISRSALLNGGTVSGGDIATGTLLQVSNGTFSGATIDSGTTVSVLSRGTLSLAGGSTNQGTISIEANATLNLSGTWSNQGIINLASAAIANLGGTFTAADTGGVQIAAGGAANITGTLQNSGNTLTFSSSTPPFNLAGGTIIGGNVAFGNNLNISSGTLSGVTVPSGSNIRITAGGTINLTGSWSNQGTINLGLGSTLNLGGSFTTAAIGTINDAGGSVNITGGLDNTGNSLTLSNVAAPWKLTGGAIIYNGTIAAGPNLSIVNGTLNGVAVASGATVNVAPGGTAWLDNVSNQGTVVMGANSTLGLGGTLTASSIGAIIAPVTGVVNLGGTLQNLNSTFTLSPQTSMWMLTGTIAGGSVAVGTGQMLSINSGTLDGVTLLGNNIAAPNLTNLNIADNLSGGGQNFYVSGKSGTVPEINFVSQSEQLSNINIVKANTTGPSLLTIFVGPISGNSASALTIAPTGAITATAGIVRLEQINLTNSTIVNNGTVAANGSTGTLQTAFMPLFTNNGMMSANNGGTIYLDNTSTIINNGVIKADGGTLNLTAYSFRNSAGATIDAMNHSQMTLSTGGNTFDNVGTITIDNSTANISGSWYNDPQSTINVINGGTLNYLINYNQMTSGKFNLMGGNVYVPQGSFLNVTGSLSGSGTINGGGGISGNFNFAIGGATRGISYDSYTVLNGGFGLNGHLAITLTNGFQGSITSAEQFILVSTSSGFGATFDDVSNGGRLETADGLGSFQVNYGTGQYVDELVLSNFQPIADNWTNAANNDLWDTAVSANWSVNSVSSVFHTGDVAAFNDSNNGSYNVTLNSTVTPGSIVFNNSAGDYSISGTGGIAGFGTLLKFGSRTVTLDTTNSYIGGTTVNAGILTAGVTGALPNGKVNITGGTLQLGENTGLAQISSLSISGAGVLDINNNHIIINYGGGLDPIASIAAWIASGYAGGTWNGTGIISTAAQTNGASYGIGYADSADPGNPAGLASGTIEIMYTLLGDANLDGTVNGTDFAILASNFNKAVTGWDQGDFNYDGAANGSDFAELAANFNKGASQSAIATLDQFAAANGLMADVPEPACGLMAMMLIALMPRRRRHEQSGVKSRRVHGHAGRLNQL